MKDKVGARAKKKKLVQLSLEYKVLKRWGY